MSEASRVAVSDSGPFISLESLPGGFDFIHQLYDKIIIPPAVLAEVAAQGFEVPSDYLVAYHLQDWVEIREPSKTGNHSAEPPTPCRGIACDTTRSRAERDAADRRNRRVTNRRLSRHSHFGNRGPSHKGAQSQGNFASGCYWQNDCTTEFRPYQSKDF